jgi:hypothetical protein
MRLRNRAVTTISSPTSWSPSPDLSFSKQPVPPRPRVGVSLIAKALHPELHQPTLPKDQEPAAMPATEEGDKEVEAKAEEQAEVRLEAQVVGEQTEFLVEVTEGEKRLD